MKNKGITFKKLQRDFGPVFHAEFVLKPEWEKAVSEKRFATVYHGENNDWATPIEATPNHHGFANTLCKIVFSKPLPNNVSYIFGMRNNSEAMRICSGF